MLVKFLARGTGSAQAAADYLLRETDSLGKVRDDVAVLRGDPNAVAAVADSLEFDHKYTSGVIAWAPEDQPSDRDIDRVLDEFEQTAWKLPTPCPRTKKGSGIYRDIVGYSGTDQKERVACESCVQGTVCRNRFRSPSSPDGRVGLGVSRIRLALSHLVSHPKTFGRAHGPAAPGSADRARQGAVSGRTD